MRVLSILVYTFVCCWLLFVPFGNFLSVYIGWDNYMMTIQQYMVPVFIGFIFVNFIFSRCIMKFQEYETDAMRNVMSALFPSIWFNFSTQVENSVLTNSKLFTTSFSDSALAASTYGYMKVTQGNHTLHIADIGVSYGLMNKLQYNSILGSFIAFYRFGIRPLFAARLDSSVHNFRGMFGWCKTEKQFKGNIIILPDHLEQKIGYLAKNIQGLKKRYNTRLVQLEDPEFENYLAVYADDEITTRMLLTPAMMRRITELRKTFGHDMMLSFSRGNFYYAAAMPEGFLRLRPKALNDGKLLEEIYNDIALSCGIADELKLNHL